MATHISHDAAARCECSVASTDSVYLLVRLEHEHDGRVWAAGTAASGAATRARRSTWWAWASPRRCVLVERAAVDNIPKLCSLPVASGSVIVYHARGHCMTGAV